MLVLDGGMQINNNLQRDLQESDALVLVDTPNNAEEPYKSTGMRNSRLNSCRRMKDHGDIDRCFPLGSVKKFDDPKCSFIDSWEDVQRCLFGRFEYEDMPAPKSDISLVHIIGERHSGTKFLTQEIQKCFPKDDKFKVHRDFMRGKHFMQPLFWDEDYRDRLIVVIVRDPYEWVAAMHEKPYHAPNHCQLFANGTVGPLSWKEFVQRPWTAERSLEDETLWRKASQESLKKYVCRDHFRMTQVMPCRLDNATAQGPPWNIPESLWRGFEPIYEQGRNGRPYQSILHLRRDKIVNFVLQIPLVLRIGGFVVVRYEDVLRRGTGFLVDQIAEITGRPASCDPTPPQPERLGQRPIPSAYRTYIENSLDGDTEQLVGYRK